MYGVYRNANGYKIDPMTRKDRNESTTSTGSPSHYYIYSRKIGFDVIPSAVEEIRLDYLGLCDNFTADDDVVLAEMPGQMDDDAAWDTICFEVASVFFRRANQFDKYELYRSLASKARFAMMQDAALWNKDKALEVALPEDYFGRSWSGALDRFGSEGDIITVI